jgi:putative redox protein
MACPWRTRDSASVSGTFPRDVSPRRLQIGRPAVTSVGMPGEQRRVQFFGPGVAGIVSLASGDQPMPTTLHVHLAQDGPSTSKVTVRSHTLFVDRPEAKGGADRGPLGGEYLLTAVGGCFSSHLLAAIRTREAAVSDVRVAVSGVLDGSPERFTRIAVSVDAVAEDRDLLQKLVTVAERACQVIATLRQSTPVEVSLPVAAATPGV